MNQTPLIALLTDFGLSDAYVGTMQGVLLTICPPARLVDLTHAIQPQNVRQAAYVLLTAYRSFPPQTVFLVVVDPGVGTARQPIAVETDHGFFVAPDNGVLTYVLDQVQVRTVVALQNPAYHLPNVSRTFHGRDIFSPVAAHLANGVPIAELGPVLPGFVRLPNPRLALAPQQIQGEVLHIDHFGNAITSVGRLDWLDSDHLRLTPVFGSRSPQQTISAASRVTLGGRTLDAIHPTYGAVPAGALTALVGSTGQLEIGVNQGSAAQVLGVKLGDPVVIEMSEISGN